MIPSVRVVPLVGGSVPEPARVAVRAADAVFATRTQLRVVRGLVPPSAIVEVLGDTAYDDPDTIRWDLPEDAKHIVVLTPTGWPSWHAAVALCRLVGREHVEIVEVGPQVPAAGPTDTMQLPVMETVRLDVSEIERAAAAIGAPETDDRVGTPVEDEVSTEAEPEEAEADAQAGGGASETDQAAPETDQAAPETDQAATADGTDQAAAAAETVTDVIGLDCAPEWLARDHLSAAARTALADASLVVGKPKHFAAVGPLLSNDAQRVDLTGDLSALEEVAGHDGRAVVLASGDPGFFGVVRALREALDPQRLVTGVRVHPAVSSVAGAFAAAALPWDDALVVSARDGDPVAAVNVCRRHPKVAVLTGSGSALADLAVALGDRREYLVVRRPGTPEATVEGLMAGEAAERGRPDEDEDGNVVLVLDPDAPPAIEGRLWPPRHTPDYWGMPDDGFEHSDGVITESEVRALALAWLGPGAGDLIWDIGAGSGSVAVECSRLGAAVIAVERDVDQCARVRINAGRHAAPVEVVEGEAPEALAGLPDPDAVFVGVGGKALPRIVASAAERSPRVIVMALATIESLPDARRVLAGAGYEVDATLLQATRLAPIMEGSRLAAVSPVLVVRGRRA